LRLRCHSSKRAFTSSTLTVGLLLRGIVFLLARTRQKKDLTSYARQPSCSFAENSPTTSIEDTPMLKQPVIEKLTGMRLLGMAEALKAQEQDPSARELSFLERFGLLVDQQWNWRENQALTRRLKNAKLRTPNACVEQIDYRTARSLDKSVIRSLTQQSAWVGTHENIFILGPTRVGKSFVACVLAQKACRDGYSALYTRAQVVVPRSCDGAGRRQLAQSTRATQPYRCPGDRRLGYGSTVGTRAPRFWEICEDRYQVRSTILTSQLPVSRWHEQIGDPTLADGILDRLVHNAHRIEMRGDSMRKSRPKQAAN
jgi:DNA replication protein DnaC